MQQMLKRFGIFDAKRIVMTEPNVPASFPDFTRSSSVNQRILPRIRHFLRARHRNGHGIHSPSIYHLVSHVLFNNNRYYCFDSVESLFPAPERDHAIGRVLFRLSGDIKASNLVVCCYSGGVDLAYLMSVRMDAQLLCLSATEKTRDIARALQTVMEGCETIDLLATDTEAVNRSIDRLSGIDLAVFDRCNDADHLTRLFDLCLERTHDETLFVIKGIHDTGMEPSWKAMIRHPKVRASLDVYHYGILLFKPDIEHRHYTIRH